MSMSNYKLGLCSVSFRDKSPEEILSAMKSAGLDHIEWGSDVHVPKGDTEKINEIAKLQKAYGIVCSSYGTYFRLGVTATGELEDYIKTAKLLGTHILRLWCGDKNSEEYTEKEKTALFNDCKSVAKIAAKNGVILCMECHNGTYTNRKESAYELMQTVNSKSFRMYWQPNQYSSVSWNIEYAKLLSPYTEHLHVFNWKGEEKYPLENGADIWKEYLNCFNKDKILLLEFMPYGDIKSLKKESQSLKEIAK